MKKILTLLVIAVMLMSTVACSQQSENDTLTIAVSILPEEAFVKAVAGDLVRVVTLIPPGGSPTNYQPSPKEMTALQDASVYLSIGVPTEEGNIMPFVEDLENIQIIHLDQVVAKVYPERYFGEDDSHHDEGDTQDQSGRDPHIWLSPSRVLVMIQEIVRVLSEIDPSHQKEYEANGAAYIKQLKAIDKEVQATVKGMDNKEFIIMHPSLGYFAEDYGLDMVAIEQDGKESTAAHLQEIIDYAKEHNIKVVFYQAEFDSSQAETIAEEIQGQVVELDILSLNYLDSLGSISSALASAQESR